MTDLHHLGVRFTMEDFGIGQRSPAYLKDLPISRMKIDKSLVMDFGNARNATIVRDAIQLAHDHGMLITAEGVMMLSRRSRMLYRFPAPVRSGPTPLLPSLPSR